MAGTNSLEIEIHHLFQEGASTEYVCRELIGKYEKNEILSPSEIEGLSHFLITCGKFDLLKNLYIKCIQKNKISTFPVGFFVEALLKQNKNISDEVIDICNSILEQQAFNPTALQSSHVKSFSVQVSQELQMLQKKFAEDRLLQKNKLIEELNNFRQANLQDQEEDVLQKLLRLFPQDLDIKHLKSAHLEKKADDILAKVISKKQLIKPKSNFDNKPETLQFIDEMKSNILKVADKVQNSSPEQLYNLAILAFQFELYDLSADLLLRAPETEARQWLLAESYLEAGRHLDLLKIVDQLEKEESSSTEVPFGAIYLKAIAYHGLGQKDMAIRLMESILAVVPSYRAADSLIHEWRNS